jgi:hypothetical protein
VFKTNLGYRQHFKRWHCKRIKDAQQERVRSYSHVPQARRHIPELITKLADQVDILVQGEGKARNVRLPGGER